jgi:hypothetical protein
VDAAAQHTCFLLGFPLSIGPAIDTGLEDLIFALELVLELVLELSHALVGLVVNVHSVWAVAALQGAVIVFSCTLRHVIGVPQSYRAPEN